MKYLRNIVDHIRAKCPALDVFGRNKRGNVSMLFALMAIPVFAAAGLGIDMARNAANRARVDSIAQSTAALAASSARAYINNQTNNVESEADQYAVAASLQQSIVDATASFSSQTTKSTNYTLNTPTITVTRSSNTLTATVNYSGTTKTTLSQIIGQKTMTFHGTVVQTAQLAQVSNPSGGSYILQESFESVPTAMQHNTWGVYQNYNGWVTLGVGIEIANVRSMWNIPKAPDGQNVAELDSQDTNGANSSMSKRVYLTVGNYELRYFYWSRVPVSSYTPTWICGSTTADTNWANAPNDYNGTTFTNQLGVYFDLDNNPSAVNMNPPATYWDGTLNRNRFDPSKNNLIDSCVESGQRWVERSVKMTVYSSGYYWLTFQGEGNQDNFGANIDNIRLCSNTCPGTVQENFPWAAGTTLMNEQFSSGWWPYAPGLPPSSYWTWCTLDTTNATHAGWTLLPGTGWATGPLDDSECISSAQGGSELEMGAWYGPYNRTIMRKLLLDPGYYEIDYAFINRATNQWDAGPDCGQTLAQTKYSLLVSQGLNYHVTGFYVDSDLMYSHLVTHTGGYYATQASTYANWDDSTTNLKPAAPSTMVDVCASSNTWVQRAAPFQITKPGYYWISFSSVNLAMQSGIGGHIANISLKALGGPSTTTPNAVVIPAPTPVIGSTINFNYFSITAN